jgi:hypothetical protein
LKERWSTVAGNFSSSASSSINSAPTPVPGIGTGGLEYLEVNLVQP